MDKIINNSELSIPRPDQSVETMTEEVILPVCVCVRAKTDENVPRIQKGFVDLFEAENFLSIHQWK